MSQRTGRWSAPVLESLGHRLLALNVLFLTGALLGSIWAIFLPVVMDLYADSGSLARLSQASREFLVLNSRVWVAVPVVALFFVTYALWITSRINRPLRQIRGVLDEVRGGDLTARLEVRDRDYLAEEARSVNAVVEALAGRVEQIRDRYEAARHVLEELDPAVARTRSNEAAAAMAELAARLDRLGESVEGFRLATAGGHGAGHVEAAAPAGRPADRDTEAAAG